MPITSTLTGWSASIPAYATGDAQTIAENPSWNALVTAVPEFGAPAAVTPNFIRTEHSAGLVPSGTYSVVRSTDGKVLSGSNSVGGRYRPLQNDEMYRLISDASDEFDIGIVGFGLMSGGARSFLQVELPFTVDVGGVADEKVRFFAAIINSFDGSSSMAMRMTTQRVWCANMLPTLFVGRGGRNKNVGQGVTVFRHTDDGKNKLEATRLMMEELIANRGDYAAALDHLANTEVSGDRFESIVKRMYPVHDDMKKQKVDNQMARREAMRARYQETPDLQGLPMSEYRVLQAAAAIDTWDLTQTAAQRNRVFQRTALAEGRSTARMASDAMLALAA